MGLRDAMLDFAIDKASNGLIALFRTHVIGRMTEYRARVFFDTFIETVRKTGVSD